jgi:hypothetical protein
VEQEALASYAHLCGRTLARAHARSADPAVLAGYMGKRGVFDDALASFAMAYAVRTRKDYEQLVTARRGAKRATTDLPLKDRFLWRRQSNQSRQWRPDGGHPLVNIACRDAESP